MYPLKEMLPVPIEPLMVAVSPGLTGQSVEAFERLFANNRPAGSVSEMLRF